MDSNLAGRLCVIFFVLTGILGLAGHRWTAGICLVLCFYYFWKSGNTD